MCKNFKIFIVLFYVFCVKLEYLLIFLYGGKSFEWGKLLSVDTRFF